ncbi:MAG: PP2C family serine/threonine-protein phosphatase [Chromatiaceae bacterium]
MASEIGGRAEQQDRVEVLAAPDRPGDYLVVLADGMGGRQHGAAAAQAVIDTAKREFSHASVADPKRFLTALCRKANDAIEAIGRQVGTTPGSTCAVLYVKEAEAYWAHVGDSRLYHFDRNGLLFRTRDHTVAELLNGNNASGAAMRGVDLEGDRLYMCLGGKNALEPEFGASAVRKSDCFVLCSDGFWDQVEAEEVAKALTAWPWKRSSAFDLVSLATQRGGTGGDNVSLALAIYDGSGLRSIWRRLLPSGMRFGGYPRHS